MSTLRKSHPISLRSTLGFFRMHALRAHEKLIAPRAFSEDDQRREFLLNVILLGSIIFSGILEATLVAETARRLLNHSQAAYHGISALAFSGIPLLFAALLWASRRGFHASVSRLLIILYLGTASYAACRWGPDLPQVILAYALIVVMASILLKPREGMVASVSVVLAAMSVAHLPAAQIGAFDQAWKQNGVSLKEIAKLGVTYLMISFVSWLSNREIGKSLARAHRSERALQAKNDSLERIVEERTRELQRVQAEKISHLYRFAEFGKLSSGIFHDLMNPLSSVAMNVSKLEASLHPDMEDIKESVSRAVRSSRRMSEFILTVKKQIQMSDLEENFLINKEIQDALTLLAHKAASSGVSLKFKAEQEIWTVGNSIQFQHVMSNLISNAIDSYEEAAAAGSEENRVIVRLRKRAGIAEIAISDKGCGISEDVIGRIFDPFFTTKGSHKGMGIGLSNTREIIEKRFSGSIRVQSAPGSGTRFDIAFPLRKCGTDE